MHGQLVIDTVVVAACLQAPLGLKFGWAGPAGVLTAAAATTAIWLGRGL